ncbi:MAG: hypothetical protein ACI837_003379 [Crocinitomicaceae bacterium]|jgi:hypothetical protein
MSQLKNKMALLVTLIAVVMSGSAFAVDLVVQEAGPVGTYASINAAVAASVDGDRIIINNKPGGFPWLEDILINKSLTFLSAVDNARFLVQGEYTVQHAPGREVNIIGMENIDGDIASIANGATSRTIVNIMWCKLTSGGIYFAHHFFELNASNNTSSGVTLVYGKVIGNSGGSIALISDAVAGIDSVHIVGNIVNGISSSSSTHYIYISNNLVNNNSSSNTNVNLLNTKSGTGVNVVRNNSIQTGDNGIGVAAICSGNIIIYNNMIRDYTGIGDYGIINYSTASLIVSFNFITSSWDFASISGFVNDGTNTFSNSLTFNGDGSSSWIGTLDGGSPGIADTDLDLTRNDPGCFGGSYSHANFFPIDGTSSKVYYLQMPSEILVGGSNAVTGHSFDR